MLFDAVFAKLSRNEANTQTQTQITRDFLYSDNVRVTTDANGDVKEVVRKDLCSRLDIQVVGTEWQIRIDWKTESELPTGFFVYAQKQPVLIREKRRRTFACNDGWCFDLTRVREAKNEILLKQQTQSQSQWKYEMEIEVSRVDSMLQNSCTFIISTLLRQLLDCFLDLGPQTDLHLIRHR